MTPVKKTRRPSTAGPATLAVDVGNSEITLGVFQDDHIVLHWRLRSVPRTPDETQLLLHQLMAPEAIDLAGLPSVLCSVVPAVTTDFAAGLERLTGVPPVIVTAETVPSLEIRYKDPRAVGADRLANAIAARELYGAPAIVVDLGTATTFDVVGEDGDFLGGAITPGMVTSAEELYRRAARLGRIDLARPERAIGTTTEESLRSGIVLGHAALVDGMVSRFLAELGGRAVVVATGGLAHFLKDEAGTLEHFDESLTLKGLRLIHESVARPETLAAWVKKQEARRTARARTVARLDAENEAEAARAALPEEDEDDVIIVHGPTPRAEVASRRKPAERAPRSEKPARPGRPAALDRPAPSERAPRPGRKGRKAGPATGAVAATVAAAAPPPVVVAAPVVAAPQASGAPREAEAGRKRRRGRRGGRRSRH